ncbi:MAG: DEAD/DEAH box helicase [Candidatus Hydrogenedentes bacterium]|nr:DEAD/DEAH box helicase [Candidatus Hydrogenedentota bacterium]
MSDTLGENILTRFTPSAARSVQEAIEGTGGREVFFAGSVDGQGRVAQVRVCARGHESAVPALFESLEVRDVVIHNHPSGNLAPSEADVQLASMYSAHGHGVYIVDNDVTRVYVVVEPFLPKQVTRLDPLELRGMFSPGGAVGRTVPGFEVRPQQVRLMEAAAAAFNEGKIAVVEAPTGVGKTFAYLLPAALWSRRNKERIVISTRTINLQEQIIDKDIPLIRKVINEPLEACLVKGRGNYLCLRKLERALSEAQLFDDETTQHQLAAIGEWAEKTEDGSKTDLPFMPGREVWERVCSESDSCSMGRCPDTKRCFVGKARREMGKADLLVVNHHMLFSDIAIKQEAGDFTAQAVLPHYKRVIFDEAHSIEDSATEYFGMSATLLGAKASFGRFIRTERGQERGLLPTIVVMLMKECPQLSVDDFHTIQKLVEERIKPALSECRENAEDIFVALRALASLRSGQIGRDIKWRLTEDALRDPTLRQIHNERVVPFADAVTKLMQDVQTLLRRLRAIPPRDDGEEAPLVAERAQLQAYANRVERVANALLETTSEEIQENSVRWIEVDARNEQFVRVARCPLEVGAPLAEWVYGNLDTVLMTSATLAVQREFGYLFQRLGLDQVRPERIVSAILDSPFDYREQAMLCLLSDVVDPSDRGFLDDSVEGIRRALAISRGHAFVLFTSFYALDHAYKRLEGELRQAGITPLRQGDAGRSQLLDRFRADTASVLFATDSFWEGVDVAGDSLQCVILPKLPFRVPTEPIQQARAEAIDARNGNAFMAYSVPQAVIKFRQGFGRLIRRRSDRGAVVVLDQRVLTKRYGRVFLESLPPMQIIRGDRDAVFEAMAQFFHPADGE